MLYLSITGPAGWTLNGETVVLAYNPATGCWEGRDQTSCGALWSFCCVNGLFGLTASVGAVACQLASAEEPGVQQCRPLLVVFRGSAFSCLGSAPCAATGDITLTVTA